MTVFFTKIVRPDQWINAAREREVDYEKSIDFGR